MNLSKLLCPSLSCRSLPCKPQPVNPFQMQLCKYYVHLFCEHITVSSMFRVCSLANEQLASLLIWGSITRKIGICIMLMCFFVHTCVRQLHKPKLYKCTELITFADSLRLWALLQAAVKVSYRPNCRAAYGMISKSVMLRPLYRPLTPCCCTTPRPACVME